MSSTTDLFAYKNHFERFVHVKSHLISGVPKNKQVFVSIIIPTYKRADLLKDAIDSAINQQVFNDYEIVIVDNDPEQSFKSATQLLVESFQNPKISYYKHDENIGMFPNWNRGIELANGKWITFLHDDDYFLPALLKNITTIIRDNSKIEGIKAGQTTFIQTSEQSLVDYVQNDTTHYNNSGYWKLRKSDNFFRNSLQSPSGIFFKKSNILQIGGFNPDFFPSSDYLFTTIYLLNYNMYHTKSGLWICRIFQNESQKIETKLRTIEQNYIIREQYGKYLGYNHDYVEGLLKYQLKRDARALSMQGINVENNFIDKTQKLNQKNKVLYMCYTKLYEIDQLLRQGRLFQAFINKLKKILS